ncbi:hypothetical protein P4233_22725 [Pseudomonas aeruginosa]|nr:hypothetical protein [Pseudomonas aeruginosa]
MIGTDPTTADNIADHHNDLRKLGWSVDELARMNVQLLIGADPQLDLRNCPRPRPGLHHRLRRAARLPGRRHPRRNSRRP